MRISLDANILIYAADNEAGELHEMARAIVGRAIGVDCILTLQSLNEFCNVALRKMRRSPEEVAEFVRGWRDVFKIAVAQPETIEGALEACRDHHLPFWDAMLWATARLAGCRYLLSEDFQDGRTLGDVTFIDPFHSANQPLLDRILGSPEIGGLP